MKLIIFILAPILEQWANDLGCSHRWSRFYSNIRCIRLVSRGFSSEQAYSKPSVLSVVHVTRSSSSPLACVILSIHKLLHSWSVYSCVAHSQWNNSPTMCSAVSSACPRQSTFSTRLFPIAHIRGFIHALFLDAKVYYRTKLNSLLTSTPPPSTPSGTMRRFFSSTLLMPFFLQHRFVFRPAPQILHSLFSSSRPFPTIHLRSFAHSAVALTRSRQLRFLFRSGSHNMQ